jgi:integrase
MHHPEVQLALRKMYRRLGRRSRQAYGLTAELIERLVEATGDDLRGLRDRALLRLAHETLLRRQELVSLRVQDIHWRGDGSAALMLRRSKTDQDGIGRWIFATGKSAHSVREWLKAAGHSSGLLFRGVTRSDTLTESLHPGYIAMRLKRLAQRAGLEKHVVQHISGHSPRVGGAQDLMLQGASLAQIMSAGGWKKTNTVMAYVERVQPKGSMTWPASR